MFKYIVKRILLSVLILAGVSLLMYALLRLMPGSYVEQKFTLNPNSEISPERIEKMKDLYGLNDPVIVGYFKWVWKALQGDFGMSFQFDAPVMEVIGDNMWISFL